MNDIHPNLPHIKLPFFTYLDWAIFFICISIVIFLAIKFIRSKAEKIYNNNNNKFIAPRFSLDTEIKKLSALEKQEKWKQFAIEATKTLKKILEKKYKRSFVFATGKEIQEILEEKNMIEIEKQQIIEFFKTLDPIKFANISAQKIIGEKTITILRSLQEKKTKQ